GTAAARRPAPCGAGPRPAPAPRSTPGPPLRAPVRARTARSHSSRPRPKAAWRTPPAARAGANACARPGRRHRGAAVRGSRQLLLQVGYLDRHQRALLALVAVAAAGAALGVIVGVDGKHAVGHRHAVVQRHAHQRLAATVGDLLEMAGVAADP